MGKGVGAFVCQTAPSPRRPAAWLEVLGRGWCLRRIWDGVKNKGSKRTPSPTVCFCFLSSHGHNQESAFRA
jgi:hypothetical protein